MRQSVFVLFMFLTATMGYASDSLQINISTNKFVKGDTLEFQCTVPAFEESKLTYATLNVWIEDVERRQRWKFRYPMINGEVSASLAISDKIPDGRYAVNFLVQRGFFKVTGEVLEHSKKDTSLTYMMIPKNKKGSYYDNTKITADGHSRLKSTLFADSAFFIFSSLKKERDGHLSIRIETPLDSAFVPVLQETRFVMIGDPKMLVSKITDTSQYVFQFDPLADINNLPNVTVNSKYKSKVQQYDDAYSSGLFKKEDAVIFDGIESDAISQSASVLLFLQGKVAGLVIEKNNEGFEVAKWRNEVAEIFIDEFRVESSDHTLVAPSEVAMIKVYRPPSGITGLSGAVGAIAIYTKKGEFAGRGPRHNFVVKGYTNMDSVWK